MGDTRTMVDLLKALDEDYMRCYTNVVKRVQDGERDEHGHVHADHEFDARQLIRSAFAYIEGAVFIVKVEASFSAEEKGLKLTPPQEYFIFELDFDLNDKGEIIDHPSKISLIKNIRFAFSIFAQVNGIESKLDVGSKWWAKLKESIKVRDRLMHPRFPEDLDVSPKEVLAMIEAKSGFDNALNELIKPMKV